MGEKLGRDHLIYDYLKKVSRATKRWSKYSADRQSVISGLGTAQLMQDPTESASESQVALKNIHDRYPLLPISADGIASLWRQHDVQWLEYVQLIDRVAPMGLMALTPVAAEESEEEDDG